MKQPKFEFGQKIYAVINTMYNTESTIITNTVKQIRHEKAGNGYASEYVYEFYDPTWRTCIVEERAIFNSLEEAK